MEPFPFSKADCTSLSKSALRVVNASLTDDDVQRASELVELQNVLAGLRARYGDHPILLETQADFAEAESERMALYQDAVKVATARGLPTLSIRLSLSSLLLELGERTAALDALQACENELLSGDESDRTEWAELRRQAMLMLPKDPTKPRD